MAVATINITLENDLLEKLDTFAKNDSLTRTDLINNSIKMYINQKQRLKELYLYGESIASQNNFTEEDIIEEIRNYRKNK
jgi:metal-responsive CopG/Arc/MetJ family transcriptional regulator